MRFADKIREQTYAHQLDANLELFDVAATRIEALESALVQVIEANSNWAMSLDDKTAEAIYDVYREVHTA